MLMSNNKDIEPVSDSEKRNSSLAVCAKLGAIELMGCQFAVLGEHGDHSGKFVMSMELDSSFSEDKSELKGTLDIDIRGLTDEENEKDLFTLTVKMISTYGFDKEYSWKEEEVDHFTSTSLLMHIWPYAREVVSNLTNYSPLPRVTLPILPIPARIVDAK
jgi:hypothetical protein